MVETGPKELPGTRWIYRSNVVLAMAAGVVIFGLALLTTWEVVRRYIFNMPTAWTLEVSEILLIFATFFGMAYTLQERGHVKVDIIYLRYRKQQKRIADLLANILTLSFWTILTWKSVQQSVYYLQSNIRSETLLAIPRFYPMAIVAIGSLLCCFQALLMTYDAISANKRDSDKVTLESTQ